MDTPAADSAPRRALRAAAILAGSAAAAVGMVAVVHDLARPYVEASQRAARTAQLMSVLGGVPYDNDPLGDVVLVRDAELLGTDEPLAVHRARLAGAPVALLFHAVAPDGYAGAIRLLVAVGADGRLLGVRVLEHRETPGLGDVIEERRSPWIHGFDGRSLGDPPPARWAVRSDGGDFDQFTGATVTPRAIVRAVRNVLVYHERHRERLLAAPADAAASGAGR
jgi:Na+-translocating ferredoxin:NAD+ oxidoreductase subunit G